MEENKIDVENVVETSESKQGETQQTNSKMKSILSIIISSTTISVIWLVLGWLLTMGIHWIVLIPFNYLLGVNLGLNGENVIGGTIGKTIILIFFNGFILTFINHKGNFLSKLKASASHSFSCFTNIIPYVSNFLELDFKNKLVTYTNIIGVGFGLVFYGILTGDGSAINSFVMLIIFFQLMGEVVNNRGIITAIFNLFMSFFGKKCISRKPVDGVVNGATIGSLFGIILSFVCPNNLLGYIIGTPILIVGTVLYLKSRKHLIKELELCEDI